MKDLACSYRATHIIRFVVIFWAFFSLNSIGEILIRKDKVSDISIFWMSLCDVVIYQLSQDDVTI